MVEMHFKGCPDCGVLIGVIVDGRGIDNEEAHLRWHARQGDPQKVRIVPLEPKKIVRRGGWWRRG